MKPADAGSTGAAVACQRGRMTDSMRVARGRRSLLGVCAAAVTIWALAASQVATAALWTGTTQGTFERSSRFVGVVDSTDTNHEADGVTEQLGSFWLANRVD